MVREAMKSKEIVDNVRQLLGLTAPARRESGDSYLYSIAERVSVDFEHKPRNSNSGDQRGRGGPRARVWDGGGGEEVGVKVNLRGVAMELTFLFAWDFRVMIL